MDDLSQSIVAPGTAPAGDSSTANAAADDAAWFENRRKSGPDKAAIKPAEAGKPTEGKPGGQGEKPAEPQKPAEPKTEPTQLEKINHAWEAKFGKESGKRKAAEEAAAAARNEAYMARQALGQVQAQLEAMRKAPVDRSRFATEGEYIRAVNQQDTAMMLAQQQAQGLGQQAQHAEVEANRQRWAAGAEAISKVLPDWGEAIGRASNVPMTNQSLIDITSSDVGHELAYYLANHPADAQALNQAEGPMRTRILARLEARAEDYVGFVQQQMALQATPSAVPAMGQQAFPGAAPAAPQALPPVAPPPLRPTAPASAGGSAAPATPDSMSMEDYFAMRRKGKFS